MTHSSGGGPVRSITNCRSCGDRKLKTILNLGEQYVSDFREDNEKPPKHPIVAVICENCMLVQLKHTTPSGEMYHENYGFKSGVNEVIKADLKENVELGLKYRPEAKRWLDIASNDGTLLSYVPRNIWRAGVDPISKFCTEAENHANYIVNGFFDPKHFDFKFDVITSISMFYDLDDPNTFVAGVKKVLAEDGIWIIQQNYLLTTLQLGAVDNFCHEHIEYYTLTSLMPLLEAHGLEIIEVQTNMVNGGSLRTVVAHKGKHPKGPSVDDQLIVELDYGVQHVERYEDFAIKAAQQIRDLKALVSGLINEGKTIYILAASTRGSTIWQSAHLDHREITAAIERNPEKVGRMFSAIGVPIISEEQARKEKPDFMLVGPWFFADAIKKREKKYLDSGGHLIIPLPTLEIV